MSLALGLDAGATELKWVVVREDGETVDRGHAPTTPDAAAWRAGIRDEVARLRGQHGLATIGVCAPGLVRRDERSVWWMEGRMTRVVGLDWAELLEHDGAVPVLNDGHAALLGERWLGAGRGHDDLALLTLGTGVGGALMVDGRLLRGHLGRAGHLGHLSLDPTGELDMVNTPGSLEDRVGNHHLGTRSGGRWTETEALLRAVRDGDLQAQRCWQDTMRALAAAIASIVNLSDPRRVVLGGGISQAGEALLTPLREWLERFEWRPHGRAVEVVLAELGTWAGAYGAAARGMEGD